MTKDGRNRARIALTVACAAWALTAPRAATAQDPPPPLLPSETPDTPPPPPPPADAPPRTDVLPVPPLAPVAPPAAPPPVVPPAPGDTTADEVVAPSRGGRGFAERTLHGHSFVTPFFNDTAFVTSNANVGIELGRQWSPAVGTTGSGTSGAVPTSYQYDQTLGLVSQYGGFGIAVGDRVELALAGSYTGLLSTNEDTALLFGAKSGWNLQPGARFRLARGSSTQLALHVYGNFGSGSQSNPLGLLQEIANEAQQIVATDARLACLAAGHLAGCALTNPAFDPGAATQITRNNFGGGATLALAHAFTPMVGLQASLGLDAAYAASVASGNAVGSAPVVFHIGIAPSLDFGSRVPLTLMAEYQFSVDYESTFTNATLDAGSTLTLRNALALGLYYTAQQRFVLGLMANVIVDEAQLTLSDGTQSAQPTTRLNGQVTAHYFF
jgi:hypothetical protein